MNHPHRVDRASERGLALVLAVVFTIIVLGIAASGALILQSHRTMTQTNFVVHGQAMGFARSGLIEALGWLRKQTSQPVTSFEPALDPLTVPPVMDTIEPDVGIVREFMITDSIWRVRSLGYAYRRKDPYAALNVMPNQVIGREMAEVELRRVGMQTPAQAALCARSASGVRIRTRGRVIGGGTAAGLQHESGTGTYSVTGANSELSGSPGAAANSPCDDSFETVFSSTSSRPLASEP